MRETQINSFEGIKSCGLCVSCMSRTADVVVHMRSQPLASRSASIWRSAAWRCRMAGQAPGTDSAGKALIDALFNQVKNPRTSCHHSTCRANLVVNTQKEDLVQRSREVTQGRGAYTSLDPVAGTFTDTVRCRLLVAQEHTAWRRFACTWL